MITELFAIFGALSAVVYLYFTWNYGYWKKHEIPHEPPKFFFGNFKEALVGTKHFGLIYNDLYKKFNNAAYYGFYKLRTPAIVIRDLDLIKSVLIKDYNNFAENDFHTDLNKDTLLAANPFFHAGEMWKNKRALWSAVLTPSKVKSIYGVMEDKSENMVKYLKKYVEENPDQPLEARELALKYLTDVVVAGMLGLQVDSFKDENNVFKRIALSFFASDFWSGILTLCFIIAPWLLGYINFGFVKPWVYDESINIAKNIADNKKKHGFTQNDFFENIMKDEEVNYVEIAGRVVGFLSEGVETSSGLTSFTLYEMASNPDIQVRLRQELEEEAATNNGKLTFEAITNNKYFDMILNETMRLYPAVLAINRVCTAEFDLPPAVEGGKPFRVPVGMPVAICNYATHHDPAYYPDPETFDPERFRDEEDTKKFSFLPFGDGPRICVGLRLGLTNTKVAIAAIIRNFEVRLSPLTKPRPLPLDPSVLVCRAQGDLWVTFHKLP